MKLLKFIFAISLSIVCLSAEKNIVTSKGNILVTGGNGYIGLSTCRALKENGYTPVSVDNSSNSAIPTITWGPIEKGDILNKKWLHKIFKKYKFSGIIHLAAKIYVPESVDQPLFYYRENVDGLLNILELAIEFSVKGIVFASTSAVYGNLESEDPVSENHPTQPLSPYAETKMIGENLLRFVWERHKIPSAILRYFNVCGIDKATDNKDGHSVHLIPSLFKAFQKAPVEVKIFGTDYSTSDGTCIRDYVHVNDVAQANVKAIEYLLTKNEHITANIGSGNSYSVIQVAQAVSRYARLDYKEIRLPRRAGDIPLVVADISKAKEIFKWEPANSALENIVKSYY